MKLADEEGRSSKESHRELNMRDKDAGDLFGIRAIEAGYFGGVAQSANNSPVLTPRGSLGELSPTFSSPRYSRTVWSASSSILDLNKYGRNSIGDNFDSIPSSQRQSHLRMPPSPTISSTAYGVRKTPSPTKSPPISPAFSPIAAPSMAYVRQLPLRPSTAERTGRHSHSPPIEPPIDMRFELPHAPLDHPDMASSPQPPSMDNPNRTTNDNPPEAGISAPAHLATLHDDDNKAPHLLLPDFIWSSAFVLPEFDRPKSVRASSMSKLVTSTKRKSMGHPPVPELTLVPKVPAIPAKAGVDASSSRFNENVQERTLQSPSSKARPSLTPPLLVESGREYFDYSRTYLNLLR